MRASFHLEHALLPSGFARDVAVAVVDGVVASVGPAPAGGAQRLPGIAVPGLPNLHCHAFQRGMAGLAERRGPAEDTFWTWRDVMYRFLRRLSPDDVEAIAAYAYVEMLERGFTTVGEFHYLHHAPDGRPYDDPGELAGRIVAAAATAGIGLALLPCYYAQGGFGGAPPVEGQRRFVTSLDGFARLHGRVRDHARAWPGTTVGVAPHSLRAVTPGDLARLLEASPDGPVHIHAAEQVGEVEDCLAWSGRRPVEWLLDEADPGRRWCLIHATHMTPAETARLAATGAVAGLCPLTEGSLGDGIFDGVRFLGAGGRFGVGTDSNIEIDAAGELRQLEYSQRLAGRGRNMLTTTEGESTGARLVGEALRGGAQALDQPIGAIAPGLRADIVVLDTEHPAFAGCGPETWLDAWVFCGGRDLVRTVLRAGEVVVADGRHRSRDAVAARYRAALSRVLA